jgi:hypothetical protein
MFDTSPSSMRCADFETRTGVDRPLIWRRLADKGGRVEVDAKTDLTQLAVALTIRAS